jgi:hypothetical protein
MRKLFFYLFFYFFYFFFIFFYLLVLLLPFYFSNLKNKKIKSTTRNILVDHLDSCLRHKSEMVVYEAARAICSLKTSTIKEITPAISVLQLFLSSPKQTLRFAAIRTLNRVSINHPSSVSTCNLDMENLITDPNRSISTLAITTLLKVRKKIKKLK